MSTFSAWGRLNLSWHRLIFGSKKTKQTLGKRNLISKSISTNILRMPKANYKPRRENVLKLKNLDGCTLRNDLQSQIFRQIINTTAIQCSLHNSAIQSGKYFRKPQMRIYYRSYIMSLHNHRVHYIRWPIYKQSRSTILAIQYSLTPIPWSHPNCTLTSSSCDQIPCDANWAIHISQSLPTRHDQEQPRKPSTEFWLLSAWVHESSRLSEIIKISKPFFWVRLKPHLYSEAIY